MLIVSAVAGHGYARSRPFHPLPRPSLELHSSNAAGAEAGADALGHGLRVTTYRKADWSSVLRNAVTLSWQTH